MANKTDGLLLLAALAILGGRRKKNTAPGLEPALIGGNITPPSVALPGGVEPGAISFSVVGARKELEPGAPYLVRSTFRNRTTVAGEWIPWAFRVRYGWSGPLTPSMSKRIDVAGNGVAHVPPTAIAAPSAPGVYNLVATLFAAVPTASGRPSEVFVETSVSDVKRGQIRVVSPQGTGPVWTVPQSPPNIRVISSDSPPEPRPAASFTPHISPPVAVTQPVLRFPVVIPPAHAAGPGPGGRVIPTVVPDPTPTLGRPLWIPQGTAVLPARASKRITVGPGALF